MKITEVVHIFGLLFDKVKVMHYLSKMYWATFWAIFFTNSPGHPACRPRFYVHEGWVKHWRESKNMHLCSDGNFYGWHIYRRMILSHYIYLKHG
jgi:hypothetical protein